MKMLERLYRSPLGGLMSVVARLLASAQRPVMIYGYHDSGSNTFRKFTRISSTVVLMSREKMHVGDNVWVWHHSILDATEGLIIEEGCQIGAWVGVFTHGSMDSIRLLGSQYVHIPHVERPGYTRGNVKIGAYTFIGAGAIILPGVTIGKGCVIGAKSLVKKSVPDYAVAVGQPARVVGSTIDIDLKYFNNRDFSDTYYDSVALAEIRSRCAELKNSAK